VAKLEVDIQIDVIDLRDYAAPIYGIDCETSEGIPASMVKLKELMNGYNGYIVSSPEHNGSMPAFLKSTLDWLSRQEGKIFQEKPVVFLATSEGARGGASVLKHLLEIMPYRGANIIGGHGVGEFSKKVQDGNLNESEDKQIITELLHKLKLSIE
jgi:NAD(P)H-dependent FMN reductase